MICGWSTPKTPTWRRSPSAARLLDRYQRTLAAFIDGARDYCTRRGMAYMMASTAVPVEELVTKYLRQRGLVR